jgi:hypothetical protein
MRNVEKILFWKPEGKKSLRKRGFSKKKTANKKLRILSSGVDATRIS